MLARSLLELATSFLGVERLRQEKLLAFRKLFAGSHSIIPKYQPLRKDVVGNHHNHVIDELHDKLLEWGIKLEQLNPHVGDHNVDD